MSDTPTKRIVKKAAAPTRDESGNGGPAPVKKAVKKMAAAPTRPRPAPQEDDDEARPSKSAVKKAGAAPRRAAPVDDGEEHALRGGWSAAQEMIDSTSTWAVTFKPTTTLQVIKVLEPKPYASYKRHWITRVGVGQRAYTCLDSLGRPCPLCDVGDRATAVVAFNIAIVPDDGDPIHRSWDLGVRLSQTFKTFANDPKVGPLNKPNLYFTVVKTEAQQRGQAQTLVNPVRERDLMEDYGVAPLSEAQVEKLLTKAYSPEIVDVPKTKDLEEIASELLNEDEGTTGGGSGWGN